MNDEQFSSYLSRALDRDLSSTEFAEFELHLLHSPDARKRYAEYVDLHNILELELHKNLRAKRPGTSEVADISHIVHRQNQRVLKISAFSAAAVLILSLIIMQLFSAPENEPSLMFQISPGTLYTLSHSGAGEAPEGLVLEKGSRLQLSQGTVELSFKSGVKSIVMAPLDMTLREDDTIYLHQGSAWFQVPRRAIGFTVKTADLNIVDLGTEFGVLATPDDHDEVHVLKGSVQVTATRIRQESATLVAGQARRADPIGRLDPIPSKAGNFLTTLPKSLPYLHWTFDSAQRFNGIGTLPATADLKSRATACELVEGVHGTAASFNGENSQILTDWPGILGKYPRTVSCWIKIDPDNPQGWAPIVEWGQPERQNYWRLRVVDVNGRAVLRLSLGLVWYDGSRNLADGKWHHITAVDAGVFGDSNTSPIRFYIDGEEETAKRQKTDEDLFLRDTREGYPLIIGAHHPYPVTTNPQHLAGLLDELYIFHGVLDETAIRSLMQTNLPYSSTENQTQTK